MTAMIRSPAATGFLAAVSRGVSCPDDQRPEPRIDVEKVTVTAVPDEGKVLIDMAYRVRATNSHQNLVYPFYVEEGSAR